MYDMFYPREALFNEEPMHKPRVGVLFPLIEETESGLYVHTTGIAVMFIRLSCGRLVRVDAIF